MREAGVTSSVESSQKNQVSPSGNSMPAVIRFAGTLGGVVSSGSGEPVVTVIALLGGETFCQLSRASTANAYVVPGARPVTVCAVALPTCTGEPETSTR